jgi:hypothetical protein
MSTSSVSLASHAARHVALPASHGAWAQRSSCPQPVLEVQARSAMQHAVSMHGRHSGFGGLKYIAPTAQELASAIPASASPPSRPASPPGVTPLPDDPKDGAQDASATGTQSPTCGGCAGSGEEHAGAVVATATATASAQARPTPEG